MAEILQYVLGNKKISKPSGEGYDTEVLPGALTATIVLVLVMVAMTAWVI